MLLSSERWLLVRGQEGLSLSSVAMDVAGGFISMM
jgi:hypothetical protein